MPKIKRRPAHPNRVFLILILSLLLFGLIVIYNATNYYAQAALNNAFRYVNLQFAWIVVGLAGFFIISNIDYKKLHKFSFYLFIFNIVFLLFLGIVGLFYCRDISSTGTSFAPCINGASRWFYVNPSPLPEIPFVGVVGFQPGELAKLSIILYLSSILSKLKSSNSENKDPFFVYLVTALLISFLLFLQPNMSTAVLIFLIGSVVYYVSGFSLKPLFISAPILTVLGFIVMLSSSYRRARFFTLIGLNSESVESTSYHIKQIMLALGSGGFFGVGFGQSRQKYQYLPEIASDSIFAIIGEEFGFIGTVCVLLAFGYLINIGLNIAKNAPDDLGTMLGAGITSWIGLQFFVNIAAMTKIIPLTGVPLPLISYGGSSMVISLLGLGILNNIYKQSG